MSRSLNCRVLVVLVLSGAGADARAALRCPHGIVEEGDLSAQVLRKCGEPAVRQVSPPVVERSGRLAPGAVTVETWVYGPSNGMYEYLRFIDGRLVEIRSRRE